MMRTALGVLGVILYCGIPAGATTYELVTFDDLVTRADVIFVGEVTDVRPYPIQTRDGTIIKTRVIFRVWDPIFGTTSALEAFDFFGGEWGDVGMAIAEMPTFAIGERRVVFARRERSINPIVGFRQGLFQVQRDGSGMDRVLTLDGVAVANTDSIGRPRTITVLPTVPMRLADFRDRISRALVEARRR